jgi:pyrroloquinoline quinone biosynthesis protein D
MSLDPNSLPKLWRLARLEFDQVRQRPVLLYPEGAVLLNDSGAAILELCDGTRSVDQIISLLAERYQSDVSADVTEYLDQMVNRELVRVA